MIGSVLQKQCMPYVDRPRLIGIVLQDIDHQIKHALITCLVLIIIEIIDSFLGGKSENRCDADY